MGKKKREFPNMYVMLLAIVLLACILTYIIPSGTYDSIILESGAESVDPNSYHRIEQTPVGIMGLLSSIPLGLEKGAAIIFFIYIIAGSFNVLQETGAIEAGLIRLTRIKGRFSSFLIPIIMIAFAMGGSCIGMCEETIIFVPIMVSLAIGLGYDSLTGVGIVLIGCISGFSAAFMNPFNVGVAQGFAELPTFSGMGLRIAMFSVTVLASIIYVLRHAAKVKKNPESSPMYEIDKNRTELIDLENGREFTTRHKLVIAVLVGFIVLLIYGVMTYGWYLTEIAAMFFALGLVGGLVGGMNLNEYSKALGAGILSVAETTLLIGFAQAILVVMESGNIVDTLLYAAANALSKMPSLVSAEGMYVFQSLLSFIIPSGSGQAAVTIPIMAPLADLVDVTRQTMVLGFQMADGVAELLTPTGGWMLAALAVGKVPYTKWLKWAIPICAIWYVIGAIFVAYAQFTGYGPF